MTGYVPRWQYPRRRPLERSAKARLHLAAGFVLLFIGLILTDVNVQGFQASRGDGTLGTYTVTRITGNDELHGTFISANRQVVIKNMGYNGNPRVSVGTTLKAIKPSWSWLGVNGESVYGPGRNSADTASLVFGGLMALVGLVYLIWGIRYLIRSGASVTLSAPGERHRLHRRTPYATGLAAGFGGGRLRFHPHPARVEVPGVFLVRPSGLGVECVRPGP